MNGLLEHAFHFLFLLKLFSFVNLEVKFLFLSYFFKLLDKETHSLNFIESNQIFVNIIADNQDFLSFWNLESDENQEVFIFVIGNGNLFDVIKLDLLGL